MKGKNIEMMRVLNRTLSLGRRRRVTSGALVFPTTRDWNRQVRR